jgi:hypothetical protein
LSLDTPELLAHIGFAVLLLGIKEHTANEPSRLGK